MWGDSDKKLRIIVLSICGLVLLVMAVGMFIIWYGSQDTDPPELGNLVYEEKEVAEEDNAITYIEKALAAVVDSKSGWDFEVSMRSDLREWRAGNLEIEDEMLSDIIASNEAALTWLERAAACESFLMPASADPTQNGWDFSGWLKLRELVRAKARWETKKGHYDEAAEILIHDWRLARLVHSNPSSMLDLFIGYGGEQLATEEMVRIAKMDDVPLGTIRRMIQVLEASMDLEASFNRATKGEYHNTCEILDHMLATDGGITELAYNFGSSDMPEWLQFTESWFIDYRFHPNRTKGIIADHYRKYASDLPATYHDAREAGLIEGEDRAEPFWRDGFKPNAYGRALASDCMLGHSLLSQYYRSKFNRDANRVALAAIAYRKKCGEFPDDLNELVGHGLEEIPVDPFDGKPMRYDATQYIIYTVGEDGVDDPNSRDSQKVDLLSEEELAALEEARQPEKQHRRRRRE